MHILIADAFPSAQQQELTAAGHRLTFNPELTGDALASAVADAEILVVRSTKVPAEILSAGKSLRLIIRAGAGTNTIDCDAAAARNIRVCNVPGANSIAVAELVMGLIICLDRNLPNNVIDLRARKWNKKKYSQAQGLYGCTLGILGLGAIGFAVAERARGFGMRVCTVTNSSRSPAARSQIKSLGIVELAARAELLSISDIVSLHLPATADTMNMVNAQFLAAMKPGAMLINTSRGTLVDETALLRAMDEKGLRAGLDVYKDEPATGEAAFESALAAHPNVVGSHHIGASTDQAQRAVAEGVVKVVAAFAEGKILNCVNG